MKIVIPSVVLGLLLALPVHATDPQPAAPTNGLVVVVVEGALDAASSARLAKHVQEAFFSPTRIVNVTKDAGSNLPEFARVAARTVGKGDAAGVLLFAGANAADQREFVDVSNRVAVVNVTMLKPPPVITDVSERLMRRVEKESVRTLGLVLGLKPCPLPLCAMRTTKNDTELDGKGLNLCAPCRVKALAVLKQRHAVFEKPAAKPVVPAKPN